jgi:deoxyribodipyrimidine photolyase-related protein
VLDDPHFLTPMQVIRDYAAGKRRLFFTDFYINQRKRLGILLDDDGKPLGGKWSFDTENRRRLPKDMRVPAVRRPPEDAHVREARQYVRQQFGNAPGSDEDFGYPIDHAGAARWLDEFVRQRLPLFGDYEDAISTREETLYHGVLTPMLNVGLLSPRQVIDAAMTQAGKAPINSLEGFIRQVIGWREFVRLVYLTGGRRQRTRNFWGMARPMPRAFYYGTTGIEPVDAVIRRVLRTGYAHHIERLMILGNFMLLCDIHPDAVFRWFMELFIDAYDWVMVPNVYGMSQHADGGLMTTKPYISGSSYVLKMSDFGRGPWCAVWDALYWRFIDRHDEFFAANPRMAMMARMKEKLGGKLREHLRVAGEFLDRLHA